MGQKAYILFLQIFSFFVAVIFNMLNLALHFQQTVNENLKSKSFVSRFKSSSTVDMSPQHLRVFGAAGPSTKAHSAIPLILGRSEIEEQNEIAKMST